MKLKIQFGTFFEVNKQNKTFEIFFYQTYSNFDTFKSSFDFNGDVVDCIGSSEEGLPPSQPHVFRALWRPITLQSV